MNIRPAKIQDARAINALINEYAEQDKMLFRSLADIYENLRSFRIAELDGQIVGCCALHIIWQDLAEIKSLAVEQSRKGTGIGRALVEASLKQARELGLPQVFALTLEPAFFEKLGFVKVDRDELPMKVWSDCARCPKQDNCDETALIKNLS
jgi:amino-acid N-acetyltransferase